MLVEEFMENFVTQFKDVETALDEAREEINGIELPEGVGPLRLSLAEIANIVVNAGGFAPRDESALTEAERLDQLLVMEGLDELGEQLYLHQFATTLAEVLASFHSDIVTLIRLNPELMKPLSPIVRHLKVETVTRLSHSRKFEVLLRMTEDVLEAIPDDLPDYVFRILGEMADFSECMSLTIETADRVRPEAANDNPVAG